jgi:hypothetical protein
MHLGTTLLKGKTMSASSRSGRDIELDAFRDEPPANVLEFTSIEVPDGTRAGGNPAALMIHSAVDRRAPACTSQSARESCPAIGGTEVDHAALVIDIDREVAVIVPSDRLTSNESSSTAPR